MAQTLNVAEALAYLRAADTKLGRIIDRAAPVPSEPDRRSTVFCALARAVVFQQLSGKAAATIFGRVCDLYPRKQRGLTAQAVLATTDANLRAAGLSRNKLLSLRDLAEKSVAGQVPPLRRLKAMEDEAIIEALTAVRGIGRWTAEMFLMFRLGRPDVLAIDDLGLRQGHAIVVGRGRETDRKRLARYGERWRPYRSVASWYLWRAVELKRQDNLPAVR
jgi:3-methyladenine DNA glycosylase/8-oxoguanine DNA glycosylase